MSITNVIKETVAFIIIKYLGINVKKKYETCVMKKIKHHWKKFWKTWVNKKAYHIPGLEGSYSYVCALQTDLSVQFSSVQFSSIQFSHSVVSDYLRPHESQHARLPCLSPIPEVHSDSHPSSLWCHPAISSSVVPFSCPQSLPASESFPMSQLFTWGGLLEFQL